MKPLRGSWEHEGHIFSFVSDKTGGVYRGDGEIEASEIELPPDEMAKLKSWADLWKWFKKQYDKRRDSKRRDDNASGPSGASGRRINARSKEGGPFVGVDSEGINIGPPHIIKGRGKNKGNDKIIQKQRSVLWMAGGAIGVENQTLADPNTLERERIWEWLLTLPRLFSGPNTSDKAPNFVSFGFNYDVGQLVAGMPYHKAWELRNGVPWVCATMTNTRKAYAVGF
jgi:hypothetical protein